MTITLNCYPLEKKYESEPTHIEKRELCEKQKFNIKAKNGKH